MSKRRWFTHQVEFLDKKIVFVQAHIIFADTKAIRGERYEMKEIMDSYLPPKNSHPLSFGDKERLCELHFFECQQQFGEFWHICTPGNLCEVLFTMFANAEHAALAVNAMSAICSALTIFFLYLTIVFFAIIIEFHDYAIRLYLA